MAWSSPLPPLAPSQPPRCCGLAWPSSAGPGESPAPGRSCCSTHIPALTATPRPLQRLSAQRRTAPATTAASGVPHSGSGLKPGGIAVGASAPAFSPFCPCHRKWWRRWTARCSLASREPASAQQLGTEELLLSCTTFNVLAPIYKRLGAEATRESNFPDTWRPRNQQILDALLARKSSVICLQEMWLSNPDLVAMYESALAHHGYRVLKLPRPNNRGDGLLTAVRTSSLQVVHHENHTLLNDCGDRVAQFLWLRPTPKAGEEGGGGDVLVVNTHLLFPHNSQSTFIRLRQVHKILENLTRFKERHGLGPTPVILCGDLNGTKKGQVYRFLRSQGFESSYDISHDYPDSDAHWVSHMNHNGVVVGVDFIWLLNPAEHTNSLVADWRAAVFSFLGKKLNDMGCSNERQAFDFFCGAAQEDDCPHDQKDATLELLPGSDEGSCGVLAPTTPVITISGFKSAVSQIGSEIGLTTGEMEELLRVADVDGNGVVDFLDFKTAVPHLFSATPLGDHGEHHTLLSVPPTPCPTGFKVKEASLFPPEAEDGIWPQDWSLSDHALLTATFLPQSFPEGATAYL